MKDRHRALPASLLQDANHFIPPAVFARAARLTFRLSSGARRAPELEPRHLQRPGPAVPALLRRRAPVAHYPVSVITDGMGLNITVMSYDGHMDFGLVADRDQMPDLADFVGWLQAELDALAP